MIFIAENCYHEPRRDELEFWGSVKKDKTKKSHEKTKTKKKTG